MVFANIRNNEIIDFNSKYKDADIERVEVSDELWEAYKEDSGKVIYKDGEVILNPDYETEKSEEETQRIANLSLTAADVERALYKAFGKDFDDIVDMVETLQASSSHSEPDDNNGGEESVTTDTESATIDIKALKIELKANNFYRGNAYVDAIGATLGITSAQLDEFFKTNDYRNLCRVESTEGSELEEVRTNVSDSASETNNLSESEQYSEPDSQTADIDEETEA